MIQYTAKNLRVNESSITLDVVGKGTLTADLSVWEDLITAIGGIENIKKGKLLGDLLEFPNDVHVEIEDFVSLAEKQKLPATGFTQKVLQQYKIQHDL